LDTLRRRLELAESTQPLQYAKSDSTSAKFPQPYELLKFPFSRTTSRHKFDFKLTAQFPEKLLSFSYIFYLKQFIEFLGNFQRTVRRGWDTARVGFQPTLNQQEFSIMKKLTAFITTASAVAILAGTMTVLDSSLKGVQSQPAQASMQTMKDATGLTISQKIAKLTEHKGQFGSGDELRRYFFGDLEPIGIQPGGAGMVVNLYNKANNLTVSYCATYDVIVAIKSGRVSQFSPNEVK
jgi:hypothetical protein